MSNERVNSHFEKTDTYEINTDFNDYTIVVHSDLLKNKSKVYLYVGEHVLVSLFGLYEVENEPVREGIAGPNTDIEALVQRMIKDYEICLHQHEILSQMDRYLEIDHVAEFHKRRERFIKPKEESREETTINTKQDFSKIPIFDWQESTEETPEQKRDRMIKETATKTGKSEESLKNLVQFREKKAQ